MPERADLAVVAPFVGLPSETFVRRHARDLAPGRTLSVVTDMPRPGPDTWSHEVRVRTVDGRPLPGRRRMQVERRWARLRGRPAGRWRWAPTAEAERRLGEELEQLGVRAALVEFLDVWLPSADTLRRSVDHLVVHGHGYDVSSRLRDPWWRDRYQGWRTADAIVVVAEHSRTRLGQVGLPLDRIEVIPCAVEVPNDLPDKRPAEGDVVRVLAVGRLVAKKGPLLTLEAFDAARRLLPELRLTMVGDGPLASDVQRFVEERGLGSHVELLGVQPSEVVQDLLADSAVFVQHSLTVAATGEEEGLPVAILEAMAAATPVVSTRHAGIPEAVVDGETGLLVDEGDAAGMADALVQLGREPAMRRSYGRAGWARALARFSAEREVADLRRVLGLA